MRINRILAIRTFVLGIAFVLMMVVVACAPPKAYHTIMTGKDVRLDSVAAREGPDGSYIELRLTDKATKFFMEYTSKHTGGYLSIVLNKKVLMSSQIETTIPTGAVVITGQFTMEEARQIAEEIRNNPEQLEFIETNNTPLPVGKTVRTTGAP